MEEIEYAQAFALAQQHRQGRHVSHLAVGLGIGDADLANGVDVVVRDDAFPPVQALVEHVPVNVLAVGLQSGAHLVGVDGEVFAVDLVQDRFVYEFLPDDLPCTRHLHPQFTTQSRISLTGATRTKSPSNARIPAISRTMT